MKNILVPVGSTENGITNLQYAVHLASISGGKVFLINAYKAFSKVAGHTKLNQLLIEENEAQLNEVLNNVNAKGVKVVAKSIKGDPFEGIARVAKQLDVDLMILSPKSISIKDGNYLGKITGKLVKQTEIPLLIIPKDYIFRKINTLLLAFKDGHFEKERVFTPLKRIAKLFSANLNLLHIITPTPSNDTHYIDTELLEMKTKLTTTENATIFQGVLEHFQSHNPDMLCVIRRKRGFFNKLWEKNVVLKKEFHTSKPLLILSGKL